MKRARWLGALAAASLALPDRPARAQAPTGLRIGQLAPSSETWPMLVAQELDFFSAAGIAVDIVVVDSIAAASQQTILGTIDLGLVSSPQLIEAAQGGAKLKIYCNQMETPPYALVAQKAYKKIADLKGCTIAIGDVNDATRLLADKMLANGGLKSQEYDEIYAITMTDRYTALMSGGVAAAMLFPPYDFRAVARGYNVLATLPAVLGTFPYTGYVGRAGLGIERADALTRFATGYLRAVRWLNDPANRVRATQIFADRTQGSSADAKATYDEVIVKQRVFPSSGQMSTALLKSVADLLVQFNLSQPPFPDFTTLFDNRFVDAASAAITQGG